MMVRKAYQGKTKYSGRVASAYEQTRALRPRWRREQEVIRAFVAEMPAGSSVLDVPFGTGRFVPIYLERELSILGVDISADMVEQSKQILGEQFGLCDVRIGDAEALPLETESVDYLVCNRFIKWLPDLDVIEKVIGEFARVVRKRMIIQAKVSPESEPLGIRVRERVRRLWRSIKKRIDRAAHLGGIRGPRRYRDADLRALFERHSLEVVRAFDEPVVGAGVRYYILEKAGERRGW
jgi:ubiquinone/menaquinone biosynthesis C-methylase UbiE